MFWKKNSTCFKQLKGNQNKLEKQSTHSKNKNKKTENKQTRILQKKYNYITYAKRKQENERSSPEKKQKVQKKYQKETEK